MAEYGGVGQGTVNPPLKGEILMAGGPLHHLPPGYDTDLAPGYWIGSTNGRKRHGTNCVASLGSNRTLELTFIMPPGSLPTGTCKLVWEPIADATSGTIVINPTWASIAVGEDRDTITLNAEGNTTVTWATGDDEEFLQSKITLDADTPVAGEELYIQVIFQSSSSLAVISNHVFYLIWE